MDPPILGFPECPILLNVRLVYTKKPRAVVFWEATLVEGGNTNSRSRLKAFLLSGRGRFAASSAGKKIETPKIEKKRERECVESETFSVACSPLLQHNGKYCINTIRNRL